MVSVHFSYSVIKKQKAHSGEVCAFTFLLPFNEIRCKYLKGLLALLPQEECYSMTAGILCSDFFKTLNALFFIMLFP